MVKCVSTLTFACFALALTAALAVPASAGMAVRPSSSGHGKAATPWSAWKPVPKLAMQMEKGCGTTLIFRQTANKVEARTRTDSDGNFQQQSRGRMYMRINPAKGHTIEVNESGPGTFTVYQNRDFYVDGRGLWQVTILPKTYKNSTPTTLPRIFLSAGHLGVFNASNGTARQGDDLMTFIHKPRHYWNLCPILKTGVVPKPFRV